MSAINSLIRFSLAAIALLLFSAAPKAEVPEVLVGNWVLEFNDKVLDDVYCEISIHPDDLLASSNWCKSQFGEENGAFIAESFELGYKGRLYTSQISPGGVFVSRWVDISLDQIVESGTGRAYWGDEFSASATMRKLVPSYTGEVCCAADSSQGSLVVDGVIREEGKGIDILVALSGTGLPKDVYDPYIDLKMDEPGMNGDTMTAVQGGQTGKEWHVRIHTLRSLTPGKKSMTINGVQVPFEIFIGERTNLAENEDQCTDEQKAHHPDFVSQRADMLAKIEAVGSHNDTGKFGHRVDVESEAKEEYSAVGLILADIRTTLIAFDQAAEVCDGKQWDLAVERLKNIQHQLITKYEDLEELAFESLQRIAASRTRLPSSISDKGLLDWIAKVETDAQIVMPKAGIDPYDLVAILDHANEVLETYPNAASVPAQYMVRYADLKHLITVGLAKIPSDQAARVRGWLRTSDRSEVIDAYWDSVSQALFSLQPMIRVSITSQPIGVRRSRDAN